MTQGNGQVTLLTVGEFAKFCQVTPRTVRFYEKRGLLTPAKIDEFNEYRYYAPEQMIDVQRIQLLRQLALTLREIKQLQHSDDMSAVINAKLKDMKRDIQTRRQRLRFFEDARELLFGGGSESATFRTESIGPLSLFSRYIANGDYAHIDGYITELERTARQLGITFTDSLTIFHELEYHPKDTAFDVALICPDIADKAGELLLPPDHSFQTLPKMEVLVCNYRGPYSALEFVYEKLYAYIRLHNPTSLAPNFEIYTRHRLNTGSEYEYETKICFPIEGGR
jgi:DNA-binding transcriptional MerR regulator/effector-binding domain-containing protein